MIIAYLRVSTEKQNLLNQRSEIERFALQKNINIDRFIMEIASGKKAGKERQLGSLLKKLKKGDTLIVTEISRLSRTLTDIMSIMGKCLEKGIVLHSVKDGYTFDDSINSKVLCFAFGLVAEIERNLISMRTKEALALRRAEGVTLGRKKGSYTKLKILMDNRHTIIKMLKEGKSIITICRHYELSRDTFEKFKKKCPDISGILAEKAKDRKTVKLYIREQIPNIRHLSTHGYPFVCRWARTRRQHLHSINIARTISRVLAMFMLCNYLVLVLTHP